MYLGPNHPLTVTFSENFAQAKLKINKIPSAFRVKQVTLKEKILQRKAAAFLAKPKQSNSKSRP